MCDQRAPPTGVSVTDAMAVGGRLHGATAPVTINIVARGYSIRVQSP
ncbi:MAG: hypothetical protein WCB51_12980 [Candidatus Dormiibacterota bacterium]